MLTKLLNKSSAVRPRSVLRSTDRNYMRLLNDGAHFTRETRKPSGSQQLRCILPDGGTRVLTSAVFYDMLERGFIELSNTELGDNQATDFFTISGKGKKILEGEDPYAPVLPEDEPEQTSEMPDEVIPPAPESPLIPATASLNLWKKIAVNRPKLKDLKVISQDGRYIDPSVPNSNLEVYTAFVKWEDDGDDRMADEEIDVLAKSELHAEEIAAAAMRQDYEPGGRIIGIRQRIRGTYY